MGGRPALNVVQIDLIALLHTLTGGEISLLACETTDLPMLRLKCWSTAVISVEGIGLPLRTLKGQFNRTRLRLWNRSAPTTWNSTLAAW